MPLLEHHDLLTRIFNSTCRRRQRILPTKVFPGKQRLNLKDGDTIAGGDVLQVKGSVLLEAATLHLMDRYSLSCARDLLSLLLR